jgi:G3E family GTPase
VFTSWGKETPKSVSYEELNNFLHTLATDESLGIIIRSKGVLKASDNEKWYYYDFVSGDYEIRLGNPDYNGRIVVIGSKMDEEKIEKLFFNKGE